MSARTLAFADGAEVSPDDGVAVYPVWNIPAGRWCAANALPAWCAPGVALVAPEGIAARSGECWPRLAPPIAERIESWSLARAEAVTEGGRTDGRAPLRFTFSMRVSSRRGEDGRPAPLETWAGFSGAGNFSRPVEVGASSPGLDPSRRFGVILSAGDIVATNVRGSWEVAVVV